jgi:molybdate transport system substrate-binding protein
MTRTSHHSRMSSASLAALVLAVAIASSAGCERTSREDRLVVFAAASLRDAFTALGDDFERAHPGVELTLNFAGTQELRTQLEHGAAADVFASADQVHMDALVRASRATAPVVFARNEPVIVVSTEVAATIRSLADLPSATHIVVGTPEVPIGRYTVQLLDRASATSLGADFRARVEARVVSRELNVRQVLAKVSLGEAQAGIVYRTDAQSARSQVSVVTIPSEINVTADYPIAVVTDTAHPTLARAFVDLVLSAHGQRALRSAGFLPPRGSPSAP